MDTAYNKIIDEVCNYICYEWSLDKINSCDDFERIAREIKEIEQQKSIESAQNENSEMMIHRHRGR